MKTAFYAGLGALAAFEVLRVYLVMPLPGSQGLDSLDVAYLLHSYRWAFRIACGLLILAGCFAAFDLRHKWLPAALVVLTAGIVWFFNFQMSAESMFQPPRRLTFQPRASSTVDEGCVVIALEHNGEARAYPVRFLAYHHQVSDTVGGMPVLVTYCSVCRSGRVFSPLVQEETQSFRLVGMNHFNAMFEDATTRSWWRQATGEAVAGPRRGQRLGEIACVQLTARTWFELYPHALVMQPAAEAQEHYGEGKFERGESTGSLTRTDHESWKEKSWIVGIALGGASKAYDWNRLKELRVINDQIGDTPIVLALATDEQGFVAFARPTAAEIFTLEGDVLTADEKSYDLSGRDRADSTQHLLRVPAFQEFWHSWRTFHPDTQRYP